MLDQQPGLNSTIRLQEVESGDWIMKARAESCKDQVFPKRNQTALTTRVHLVCTITLRNTQGLWPTELLLILSCFKGPLIFTEITLATLKTPTGQRSSMKRFVKVDSEVTRNTWFHHFIMFVNISCKFNTNPHWIIETWNYTNDSCVEEVTVCLRNRSHCIFH